MPGQQQQTPSVSYPTAAPSMSSPSTEQAQPHGNDAAQSQLMSTPNACGPDSYSPPGPVTPDGGMYYYQNRNGDFAIRYDGCGLKPPTYYLAYGNKYIHRFKLELRPRLSPEGQAWLDRAAVNLQVAIEDRRAADPAAFDQLEKQDSAFTAFAYGTHADAYWYAGLGDLGIFDLAKIGLTPDVKDLVTKAGLAQVMDIGTRLLETWGEEAIDYVAGDGATDVLVEKAYEGMCVVGDNIDMVFGEGTAATLAQRADDLGQSAQDLASNAYDVAEIGVTAGIGAVDDVFGEGTVNNVAESGRAAANTAVDWVSDTWDDIFN